MKVYPDGHPEVGKRMFAMINDQSNRSLVKSSFFSLFNIENDEMEYTISSCAGNLTVSGRCASGFTVESMDGHTQLSLPDLIECDYMPDVREEIPTPEVARYHSHLKDIAGCISPLDAESNILLLIGRDLIEAHHVHDQRIGPRNSPYAQKLSLGWVVIGETCLGKVHRPDTVNVKKTYILGNGRESIFKPCSSEFVVHENEFGRERFGATVSNRTKADDKPGLSVEDVEFLKLMDKEFKKDPSGNWVAPLPFRSPRPRLPNNRPLALKRARSLQISLQRDPDKKEHFVAFMKKIFDSGHAEVAPPLGKAEECWYLPIFGVYHPKKPDQIRGVFDSSAQFDGISLNSVLLSGPDLTNSLLGVLLKFRREPIAITADVEQMFHCFHVREDHRNFLRFMWYEDNDPEKEIIEFRMTVHVFGNSPSPAVATYGLHRTAAESAEIFGVDVKAFIEHDFYVDDGISSLPSAEEAIDLLRRTKEALLVNGNLRLHKIASNNAELLKAFPEEELSKSLKGLDFHDDSLPLQHSLGLNWDLRSDCFSFKAPTDERPFTRRGVLSVVNSLFDPLGFVAPITIQGKLFLREFLSSTSDWDEPLPEERLSEWQSWRDSLQDLQALHIQRTFSSLSFCEASDREIHIFSDASEKAIAAVAYLKMTGKADSSQLGFFLGKAKVAPLHGHTIPRLELCGAVLAVEIAEVIEEHVGVPTSSMHFYTDSRVVLGYINNVSKRFYVYVANRVHRIRKSTSPNQWSFVPTEKNPADSATRSVPVASMQNHPWLKGPSHLLEVQNTTEEDSYPLMDPDDDKEIRPSVQALKTSICPGSLLGSHHFEKFSVWGNLVRIIAYLKHICASFQCKNDNGCKGWHKCSGHKTVKALSEAEQFIVRVVQTEAFGEELSCIVQGRPLPRNSPLLSLNPILDECGLLRVGGRLNRSGLENREKHPIIVPGRHHIATLLIRHHHSLVKHQGRHLTEGAVRAAGYWVIGGKRVISSILHKCVKCRKLRGKYEVQKMADLPLDRLQRGPPFSSVGVDTFGPWSIVSRRTRGGLAESKRWAILFTCLTTRAIHIEVVEELSTSSFINALRRFVAIRGNVKELRSDRGTNFIGAVDALKADCVNVEDTSVKKFLNSKAIVWYFNPPHSSHMGGVWERMIGVTRRILESMLSDVSAKNLSHEVLTTFMAEVCAIVNARPLIAVSHDPEAPEILSPSLLLNQKSDVKTEAFESFDLKNLYKAQWKRVQTLADLFWNRWRQEYLITLQKRRIWQSERPNLKDGDVVLLKDADVCRNEWPMGVVVNAIWSSDSKVRKAEVCIIKDGKRSVFTRPVTELVVLLSDS